MEIPSLDSSDCYGLLQPVGMHTPARMKPWVVPLAAGCIGESGSRLQQSG